MIADDHPDSVRTRLHAFGAGPDTLGRRQRRDMTQTGTRPLYLDTKGGPTLAFLDAPDSAVWSGTAIVIVGPWGWDEVVTNRSRKDWAEQLVRLGHATLRID